MLLDYLLRLVPGFVLAGVLFLALRRAHPLLHLTLFVFLFIFTRDAMTPLGLWRIGNEGFLWIRFTQDPLTLLVLGLSSIGFVVLMQRLSPWLAETITWFQGNLPLGILTGAGGAVLSALPVILVYRLGSIPLDVRGGPVPALISPLILLVTLGGNLYEEVLFRGYLYGWLTGEEQIQPVPAGLLTGVFFSFGHIFLAYNVTAVGLSVLIFALWEGCLAGLIRARYGLIPAVLSHGLAVFLLTSGWF